MLDEQIKLLEGFERRVAQLIAFCNTLRQGNARLKEEISERDDRIKQANDRIVALEIQYDNLLAARSVAGLYSQDGNELARGRLSKLVREIDKCIALLNE